MGSKRDNKMRVKLSLAVILVMLLSICILPSCTTATSSQPEVAEDTALNVSGLHGFAPSQLGLAITSDGRTAYVSFSLDDSLLAVDLSTFTIERSTDVSEAGVMQFSGQAVLSQDESKLYVANHGTKKVMIIDTVKNGVEKVLQIEPIGGDCLSVSHNETKVFITSTEGLYVVNSSDGSYSQIDIPGIFFESVEPSVSNPNLLYCIGELHKDNAHTRAFFIFDLSSNAVLRTSNLPDEALRQGTPRRFSINSDETTAYFGSWENINDKGVGNFNVFDLDGFQIIASTPIECGVSDFALNEETGRIYIIGFWAGGSAPQTGFVRVWDISDNEVIRKISVSPSSDQRAIAIDPVDSNILYMTEGDFNFIRKVEISTGKEVQRLKFNKQDLLPVAITPGDDNVGYIRFGNTNAVYELDLDSGNLIGYIQLPDWISGRAGGGYYRGKLFFTDPEAIYSIDPSDGSIIESYKLDTSITPINTLDFTFFDDKLAFIDYIPGGMVGKRLLLFDAKDMTLLKSVILPKEPHGKQVIVSLDGSKLYIASGPMDGPTLITIFNSSTLSVINAIEIPFDEGGTTSFLEYDFDEDKRILYLCGFVSIYKIDMDTDELIGTLHVYDLYKALNIYGSPTGLSGVVLSSAKDKLLIISGDSHCIYTYDLVNSSWTTRITNLKGYLPVDTECSADRKYMYTVNSGSDSISMVDIASGDIIKIIELAEPEPTSISITMLAATTTIGDATTIEGSITPIIPNATVTIYYSPESRNWMELAEVTTDNEGCFSHEWSPNAVGEFEVKASWTGNVRYEGAESGVVKVSVEKIGTSLTLSVSEAEVDEGEPITISGAISPLLSDKAVTLTYTDSEDSSFERAVRTSSEGAYRDSYTPTETGQWSVKASWEGDPIHSGSTSQTALFTVVESEPELEPEPEPEPESEPESESDKSGGIPRFPFESIVISVVFAVLALWLIQRQR